MIAFTSVDQRAEEAAQTECPRCGKSFHVGLDDEDDWDGRTTDPVAATERAADCCLFHEFDHAARRRIASRVDLGDTWLEAIAAERQGASHG